MVYDLHCRCDTHQWIVTVVELVCDVIYFCVQDMANLSVCKGFKFSARWSMHLRSAGLTSARPTFLQMGKQPAEHITDISCLCLSLYKTGHLSTSLPSLRPVTQPATRGCLCYSSFTSERCRGIHILYSQWFGLMETISLA